MVAQVDERRGFREERRFLGPIQILRWRENGSNPALVLLASDQYAAFNVRDEAYRQPRQRISEHLFPKLVAVQPAPMRRDREEVPEIGHRHRCGKCADLRVGEAPT